jgi:hypothetical protein
LIVIARSNPVVGSTTVNVTPLLGIPATDTTTFPVDSPEGTVKTMAVALQELGVIGVPLKVTVLEP